ncbi:hemerythrin domain-containing protein [Castellaniella sp. GW247-6E4]|uniref:hemerythrin domain-containing protein n=1 Tax=Castellaniella sp. GW247-6E4 TaxID=3140380 RepID=UPI003314D342
MDINRFKHQHVDILSGIAALRKLAHQGISEHAVDIAHELKALSTIITTHLAIEDRILYPSLRRSGNASMALMAQDYQDDMKGIANAFINFARRWSNATQLSRDPEKFRDEANTVLRDVHARMVRENREFYPAIEAL